MGELSSSAEILSAIPTHHEDDEASISKRLPDGLHRFIIKTLSNPPGAHYDSANVAQRLDLLNRLKHLGRLDSWDQRQGAESEETVLGLGRELGGGGGSLGGVGRAVLLDVEVEVVSRLDGLLGSEEIEPRVGE